MIVFRTKLYASFSPIYERLAKTPENRELRRNIAKGLLEQRKQIKDAAAEQLKKNTARLKGGGTITKFKEGQAAIAKARSAALGSALSTAKSVESQAARNGVKVGESWRSSLLPTSGFGHKNYRAGANNFKQQYKKHGPADLTLWDRMMGNH